MNSNKKGYYVYSTFAVIFGFALFGLIVYLIYDIVNKLITNEFNNVTIVQSIITLVGTIFLGGYFTKGLELRNNKKLEKYKTRKEIAIRIIDLAGLAIRNQGRDEALELLYSENLKAKLFFGDDVVLLINSFVENQNKETYIKITDNLKKYFS